MNLDVVFDHKDWMVLNKPAGVNVHGDESESGFVAKVKYHFQYDFLAPVHRLDKVTSGCFILAKSSEAARDFATLFESGLIEKFYLALTSSKPKKKQGTIKGDMVASRGGNWKLLKECKNPAVTQFFSEHLEQGVRLNVVKLITGKTHQIRVAMKSNSSSILGDERYGDKKSAEQEQRCYLHCWKMRFTLKNQAFDITCLPSEGERFKSDVFLQKIKGIRLDDVNWPTVNRSASKGNKV